MRVWGEAWVQQAAFGLALAAEAIAVVMIAFALFSAAVRTARAALDHRAPHPWTNVRLDLARTLALALEFLLAADIVRTAVAPTWNDVGKLAAIAVIRTGLNYFLQRDIDEADATAKHAGENAPEPHRVRHSA